MFRANTVYEGQYLLGTSIARPLIAKKQIEIARKVGADAVCSRRHRQGQRPGALRARLLRARARHQDHRAVARVDVQGPRGAARSSREKHQIPIAKDKEGEAPFSVDANLLHSSSEGKVLEDPAKEAPGIVYQRTISPMEAPDKATEVRIGFEKGDAVSHRRQEAVAGDAAHAAQRARPRQRHRPPRPGREPLRRHEVARRLRDARRHHPACGAPRHRIDHARPRRRRISRTS